MKKIKATVLLTVVLVITAILTAMAFARFPVGTKDFNGFLGAIRTDYDISGGTAYTLTLADDNVKDVKDVNEVINVLKYRLNLLGYQSYSVKAIKEVDDAVRDYDIRIELRGSVNRYGEIDSAALASDVSVVSAYGELVFYGGTEQNPTEKILTDGVPVADAAYGGTVSDGNDTYYVINITFSDYGYNELKSLIGTGSYYLRIDVGDNTITGEAGLQISASTFSKVYTLTTTAGEATARRFALQMKTGGLAYKYDVSAGEEVSSPLGANVGTKCFIAIAALFAAIIVYAFVADKKYGLVTFFSAVLFGDLYLFFLIAVPGVTLSLGGVIGFAAATLLFADGLNAVNKRIKEEFGRGKTVKSAVKAGYNGSLARVLGSAGICVVCSLILLAFTSGIVANFAMVFAIGAALAAATVTLIARMFGNLLLPIAEYKPEFIGLVRNDTALAADEKGE